MVAQQGGSFLYGEAVAESFVPESLDDEQREMARVTRDFAQRSARPQAGRQKFRGSP